MPVHPQDLLSGYVFDGEIVDLDEQELSSVTDQTSEYFAELRGVSRLNFGRASRP
jgi:hypothetical protein